MNRAAKPMRRICEDMSQPMSILPVQPSDDVMPVTGRKIHENPRKWGLLAGKWCTGWISGLLLWVFEGEKCLGEPIDRLFLAPATCFTMRQRGQFQVDQFVDDG